MSELGDALGSHATEHGDVVRHGLAPEVAGDVARDAVRRRGRRLVTGTSAALVAVVAAGGTAWALAPEPPVPAMQVADAVVADVPPIPSDFRGETCSNVRPDPYVPWAAQGVTISSEDVREMGLEVTARLFEIDPSDGSEDAVEVDPGTAIVFDESGSFEVIPDIAGVEFDISWRGEALYQVDATAILVSGERVMTPLSSWEAGILDADSGPTFPAESTYDPQTDTSRAVRTSIMQTGICGYGSSQTARPIPPGPASVHTLVQIKDEAGVPLATWVDSNGIDGTTVDFDTPPDASPVRTAEPVPDEERETVLAERAELEPVPSGEAVLRDLIAQEGEPLGEAQQGLVRQAICPAPDSMLLEEPVYEVTDFAVADGVTLLPPLPSEVPFGAVDGGTVTIEEGARSSGISAQARVFFLDSTGAIAGLTNAVFTGRGYGGTWEFVDWEPCDDVSGLVAGEAYTVVGQTQVWDERWVPTDLPQPAVWDIAAREVMGTVTLVDAGAADE
ncbi:hypothetical protein [Demequina flava]|uniref:hypothetical protein n=1 Tax=Demequina flava TaxID=1095025 RepID=UPI0007824C33|nr:hypothetical protein [Demequina flava]